MLRPDIAAQLAAAGAIAAGAFAMARSLRHDQARCLAIVRSAQRVPVVGRLWRFVMLGNVPSALTVDDAMERRLLELRSDYYVAVGVVMIGAAAFIMLAMVRG